MDNSRIQKQTSAQIIYCPGIGRPASDWDKSKKILEEAKISSAVFFPPFNNSTTPWSLRANAIFLKENCQPGTVLVGHSFGGFLVEAAARLFPQHWSGIVLADPSVPNSPPPLLSAAKNWWYQRPLAKILDTFNSPEAARAIHQNAAYRSAGEDLRKIREKTNIKTPAVIYSGLRYDYSGNWKRAQQQSAYALNARQEYVDCGHLVPLHFPEKIALSCIQIINVSN